MATAYQPQMELSSTGSKPGLNYNEAAKGPDPALSYQGQGGYVGVAPVEYTEDELERMRKTDAQAKHHVRVIKFVSRAANTVLAVAIAAILGATLHKYLSTRGIEKGPPGHERNAWAKETKLWPNLMLFTVSVISLILNLLIMASYFFSVKFANIFSTTSTVFSSVTFLGHIVLWAVVAGLYRYGKDTHGKSNDLWGWTCSNGAAEIQEQFKDVVDFHHFCGIQGNSWHLSIASAIVEIIAAITWAFIVRRTMHQKKMEKLQRKSMAAQDF